MKKGKSTYYYKGMPNGNGIKSMASIHAKSTRSKESEKLAKARKNLESEFKEEQEEIKKAINSGSYLSERIKNIFALPYERVTVTDRDLKNPKNIKIRQVNFASNHLDQISVLFTNFRQIKIHF